MDYFVDVQRALSVWNGAMESAHNDVIPKLRQFTQWHDQMKSRISVTPIAGVPDRPDDTTSLDQALKAQLSTPSEQQKEFLMLLVRAKKILSRRDCNRSLVRRGAVIVVVDALRYATLMKDETMANDAATYLQNVFHDSSSSVHSIDAVPALLQCIASDTGDAVKATCLAALQNVSLQRVGQDAVTANGGIEVLVSMLFHGSDVVCRRSIATIHNTVASLEGCRRLREAGGIPIVISLLSFSDDPQLLSSAAGTVQNLCREKDSVHVLVECNATLQLCGLLSHKSPSVLVCVVGALLNVCSSCAPHNKDELKKILTVHVAATALADALK